jgi:bifunctional DNA-binding transcriptional regulator/antitoxin component of YhaV-PrlF toxin-antitoxin module
MQNFKYRLSHILKWEILKVGKTEIIKTRVDERGRIIIPAKVRRKMKIEPMTRIDIKIERVHPKESLLELADGFRKTLKKKEDAVKVLYEESPFR